MKNIKKSDLVLLGIIIVVSIILITVFTLIFIGKGDTVVVRIDGEEYAKLSLNKDTELLIQSEHGENLLIIKDSKAWVDSASCPNQVCVNSGELTELSPIVCKHNHVSITLE